jgi:hypothetical protein
MASRAASTRSGCGRPVDASERANESTEGGRVVASFEATNPTLVADGRCENRRG